MKRTLDSILSWCLVTVLFQFNGEPRSYTRFNLTQNMEGDNSHVEMKLSSDMDDEVEANGVGENTNQHNRPYYPSKLNQRSPKTICGYVIGILFLFIIGKPICWYIFKLIMWPSGILYSDWSNVFVQ